MIAPVLYIIDLDPHYLECLRNQAEQLNSQITALSLQQQPRSTPPPVPYTNAPAQVSYSHTSRTQRSTQRNLAREGSKWKFYAVKNGLEGDEVYLSWHHAHPFCWDPNTQYFFLGTFCKGFDNYDQAWDFLLGVPQQLSQVPPTTPTPIPQEPPAIVVPLEPINLHESLRVDAPPALPNQDPPIPVNNDNDATAATYVLDV